MKTILNILAFLAAVYLVIMLCTYAVPMFGNDALGLGMKWIIYGGSIFFLRVVWVRFVKG